MFARAILLLGASLMWAAPAIAQMAGAPLVLEKKIPLGEVSGRIDHLGIDVKRRRLFVAEFGNDSLGVVGLAAGKVLRTIGGFSEPQGVAYVALADSVYVANGGDGSVRALRGEDFAPIGRIELGEDADNVRVDVARNRVLVGLARAHSRSSIRPFGPRPANTVSTATPKVSRSTSPGPGSLSMYPTHVKSRSSTLRQEPIGPCRRKARDRIFRWRSIATHAGFSSSFAAHRP